MMLLAVLGNLDQEVHLSSSNGSSSLDGDAGYLALAGEDIVEKGAKAHASGNESLLDNRNIGGVVVVAKIDCLYIFV